MTEFKQILLNQNPKYKRLQSIQSTIECQSKDSVKKTKAKRAVLNSFDTLIALLVISPLVIGNWRGSWVLMDLHSEYFPPYESWLFCCCLHCAFMLLQWIFRDCSKEQRNTYLGNLFFQVWRRIYITVFAESIIMMWRGGWLVYDGWFGVTMVDAMRAGCYDGAKPPREILVGCENVTVYGAPNIAAFTGTIHDFNPCPCATNDLVIWITLLIMVAMLAVLRSVRNNLAVPFIIAVDSETSSFVFPTRFRTEITPLSIHIIQPSQLNNFNNEMDDLNNATLYEEVHTDPENSTIPLRELSRLISLDTLQDSIVQRRKSPPRPFLHGPYDGPIPTSFRSMLSPYNRNKQQENWAQLSQYKSPVTNPKNIQDILNYVSIRDEKFITSQSERDVIVLKPTEPFKPDPFFKYRPQEPSDINLLATANFKFAPPIWKNLRTSPKPSVNMLRKQKRPSSYAPMFSLPMAKRPFTVTLNVFPMQGSSDNGPPSGNFGPYLVESESIHKTSFTTPPSDFTDQINNGLFLRREKNVVPTSTPKSYAPQKMIIHLNLFPDEDIYRSIKFLQRMDNSVEV